MTTTHTAVKLTVIAERLVQKDIEAILAAEQVSGFSIFPGGGKGTHGIHHEDSAELVHEFSIIRLECLLINQQKAERIGQMLADGCLTDYSGIVWLQPVEVFRAGKFR